MCAEEETMMGWFTGNREDTVGRITFEPQQSQVILREPEKKARFVEFEGAFVQEVEDTGKLEFIPRGPIHIRLDKIGAFYDHTVILFGNKIRVMETAAQIELKLMEAMK